MVELTAMPAEAPLLILSGEGLGVAVFAGTVEGIIGAAVVEAVTLDVELAVEVTGVEELVVDEVVDVDADHVRGARLGSCFSRTNPALPFPKPS